MRSPKKANPDYIAAAYFAIVALFCLYEMALGAQAVSPMIVFPLFSYLAIATFFVIIKALSDVPLVLAYLMHSVRGLPGSPRSKRRRAYPPAEKNAEAKMKEPMGLAVHALLALVMISIASMLLQAAPPGSASELFSLPAIAAFAGSIFLIFEKTFPRDMPAGESGFGFSWRKWVNKAALIGADPGAAALIVLGGAELIFPSREILPISVFILYVLIMLFIYVRLSVDKKLGAMMGELKDAALIALSAMVGLAIAFAFISATSFLGGMIPAAQRKLATYALAYAWLAVSEAKDWKVSGLFEPSNSEQKSLP
ncbi:MAG: hypothetical protein N3G22_03485 [Candidatus Micrarchaeota archaeon]|nr:hypothetical protein [Candidatus Micrarchaeota archaeon]